LTNLIADAACPDDYSAAFLEGTQPTDTCDHVNGNQRNLFQRIFGVGGSTSEENQPSSNEPMALTPKHPEIPAIAPKQPTHTAIVPPGNVEKKKKRGFWSRLFGVNHDDDSNGDSQHDQQE
jgi:penicillin-binding protein 1B